MRAQIVYAVLNFESRGVGPLSFIFFLHEPLLAFPGSEELGLSGAW